MVRIEVDLWAMRVKERYIVCLKDDSLIPPLHDFKDDWYGGYINDNKRFQK